MYRSVGFFQSTGNDSLHPEGKHRLFFPHSWWQFCTCRRLESQSVTVLHAYGDTLPSVLSLTGKGECLYYSVFTRPNGI